MADIIKTGTVVIDFKSGKTDIKPPNIASIEAAKKRELSLVEEILQQEEKVKQAQAQAAAAAEAAAAKASAARRSQLEGANQLAEGMLKVGRAAVLAGATGSESMQDLVRGLVAAQVAVDIFTGGTTALKGFIAALGAARIATLGLAGAIAILETVAAPLLVVLALIAAAYLLVAGNAEKARQEQEKESQAAAQRTQMTTDAIAKAVAARNDLNRQIRETMTLQERAAAIAVQDGAGQAARAAQDSKDYAEAGGGAGSGLAPQVQAQALAQNAVSVLREQAEVQRMLTEKQTKALDDQAAMVTLKQQELKAAEAILKTEEAKTQAFLAQFGALSKGEQERLKRIDKKINNGEDLSRSELNALGKAGGAAAEAAARIWAERGRAAGGDNLLFGGKDTAAAAQRRVSDIQGEIGEITGGLGADEALRAIKARKAEVEKEFDKFLETNLSAIREAINTLLVITERIKKVEIAQAKVKGR